MSLCHLLRAWLDNLRYRPFEGREATLNLWAIDCAVRFEIETSRKEARKWVTSNHLRYSEHQVGHHHSIYKSELRTDRYT